MLLGLLLGLLLGMPPGMLGPLPGLPLGLLGPPGMLLGMPLGMIGMPLGLLLGLLGMLLGLLGMLLGLLLGLLAMLIGLLLGMLKTNDWRKWSVKHVEKDMQKFFGGSYVEPLELNAPLYEHTIQAKQRVRQYQREALKDIANPIPTDSWLPGSFTKRQAD